MCLINEQGQINEQALNSKVLPACFLFTVYVVPNKRAGAAGLCGGVCKPSYWVAESGISGLEKTAPSGELEFSSSSN